MKPETIMLLSCLTRPVMRYRTPAIHRLLRWVLNIFCPPAKKEGEIQLVASFDGGIININTSSSLEYNLLFCGCHEPEIVNLIKRAVLNRLRAMQYDVYYIRKNATRPLSCNQPPHSCELFCVPCIPNNVTRNSYTQQAHNL